MQRGGRRGSFAVPATVQQSPAAAISAALGSSCWLAERARAHGVGALVYLSSGGTVYAAHETSPTPHREDECLLPSGTYGALKAATETVLTTVLAESRTRLATVRVANAYGERQNRRAQGIVAVSWRNLLAGKPVTLFGGGEVVRDFIHAADVGS